MKRLIFLVIGITLFLSTVGSVFAAYPFYTNYVNDYADVLTQQEEDVLNKKLSEHDKKTTNQIAVVTIESSQNETIEEYTIHLAEQWKVGQKYKDNGVIMLFAMKDRKMRIEVGRGLEGDLTDIESKHILDDTIVPEFKQEQYYNGISNGVDAVILAISTEGVAGNSATPIDIPMGGTEALVIFITLGILVVVTFIAFSPWTPFGGNDGWGYSGLWSSGSDDSDSDSGGSSFGGGSFSGGGASSSW